MSRWRREWLGFGLDGNALVAASADDQQQTLVERTPDRKKPWDERLLVEALRPQLASHSRSAGPRVLVAPDLCKHWTQEPPAGLHTLAELQQLTAKRCAHLFGGGASDWTVVADWSLTASFACSALPTHLLNTWAAVGRTLRRPVRVESAVMAVLSSLAGQAPANGWLVWHTPLTLVTVRFQGARVSALRCLRHSAAADADESLDRLGRALHEERLATGASVDDEVMLGNSISVTALPRHKFAAPDQAVALPSMAPGANDATWAACIARRH